MDLTKFKKESDELRANLEAVAEYLNKISSTIPEINAEVKKVKDAYSADYITKTVNLKTEMSALKGIDKNAKAIMKQVTEASLNDLESRMTAIEAGVENSNRRIEKVEKLVADNNKSLAELGELIKALGEKVDNIKVVKPEPEVKPEAVETAKTEGSAEAENPPETVTETIKEESKPEEKTPAEDKKIEDKKDSSETSVKENFSRFFIAGRGQEKSKAYGLAQMYYLRGANRDDADCAFALADMYYEGKGIPKNLKEALKYYQKYAELRPGDHKADERIKELKAKGL